MYFTTNSKNLNWCEVDKCAIYDVSYMSYGF